MQPKWHSTLSIRTSCTATSGPREGGSAPGPQLEPPPGHLRRTGSQDTGTQAAAPTPSVPCDFAFPSLLFRDCNKPEPLRKLYCRFLKTLRFAISRGAGLHFGERGRLRQSQAPAAPRAHESCAVQRQKRARHIKVRPPGTLRPCGAVRAAVCACWARATCLCRSMPARVAPRTGRAHAGGLSPRRCCAKHVEGGPPGGLAAAHR